MIFMRFLWLISEIQNSVGFFKTLSNFVTWPFFLIVPKPRTMILGQEISQKVPKYKMPGASPT